MNKKDLIEAIAKNAGINKSQAELAIAALAVAAAEAVKAGGEVTIPGICKLSAKAKAERPGRNPATGETVMIPARNAVKFTPLKVFKDYIQ